MDCCPKKSTIKKVETRFHQFSAFKSWTRLKNGSLLHHKKLSFYAKNHVFCTKNARGRRSTGGWRWLEGGCDGTFIQIPHFPCKESRFCSFFAKFATFDLVQRPNFVPFSPKSLNFSPISAPYSLHKWNKYY